MRAVSNTPSRDPGRAPDARAHRSLGLAVLGVYTPLALYLFRGVQRTGDGAAYTLQAVAGDPLARAVHAGWLVPLSAWTRTLHSLGVPPSVATNAASALVLGGVLLLLVGLGRDLARGWAATLPAFVALGAAATWDAALFCEVYGALSFGLLGAVLALRRRRGLLAGLALFWAAAVHPGALFLAPTVLLLGGRKASEAVAPVVLAGALLAAWVLLIGPEVWIGPRGLGALPGDLSPGRSLQRAWRLLARDLGLTALPLLLGAFGAPRRRWLLAIGCGVLGSVIGLDRFGDNPGHLPLLFLTLPACALAPGLLRSRRGLVPLLWLLVALGVAEGTSRHDARARRAVRDQPACGDPVEDYRTSMLDALACSPSSRGADAARPRGRVRTKRAPLPSSDEAVIVPPSSSARLRATESPSPVPP